MPRAAGRAAAHPPPAPRLGTPSHPTPPRRPARPCPLTIDLRALRGAAPEKKGPRTASDGERRAAAAPRGRAPGPGRAGSPRPSLRRNRPAACMLPSPPLPPPLLQGGRSPRRTPRSRNMAPRTARARTIAIPHEPRQQRMPRKDRGARRCHLAPTRIVPSDGTVPLIVQYRHDGAVPGTIMMVR